MGEAADKAYAAHQAQIGTEEGVGEWMEIDQERVNAFADVTIDHQFIHVDPEAAKATPFGGPIAHGFLTLSLLTHLSGSIKQDPSRFAGVIMGVNYGFDKVRFLAPVPVGSRVRARSVLKDVKQKGDSLDVTREFTIEIDGGAKPALVADWITRLVFG